VIKSETKEQGRWQAGATREVSAGFGGETWGKETTWKAQMGFEHSVIFI
jgi:hypothetical protein